MVNLSKEGEKSMTLKRKASVRKGKSGQDELAAAVLAVELQFHYTLSVCNRWTETDWQDL